MCECKYVCVMLAERWIFRVQQKGCIVQMAWHDTTGDDANQNNNRIRQDKRVTGKTSNRATSLIILTRAELKIVFIEK